MLIVDVRVSYIVMRSNAQFVPLSRNVSESAPAEPVPTDGTVRAHVTHTRTVCSTSALITNRQRMSVVLTDALMSNTSRRVILQSNRQVSATKVCVDMRPL
jgi:hypothetical protein